MAGQNHEWGGLMTFKRLAMQSAHGAGFARLVFMILSGHDSVTWIIHPILGQGLG
jgi:hypothetical protein